MRRGWRRRPDRSVRRRLQEGALQPQADPARHPDRHRRRLPSFVFALKTETAKMTAEQIAAVKKNIYVLPQGRPRCRSGASSPTRPTSTSSSKKALIQLGWEGDKAAIPLAIKALSQVDHRIRGVAAQVLAYYGSPDADSAKDPLQKALLEADDSDRPQITWALVTLHDARVFDKAMELYRKGHLTKVQRLGGGPAFDPEDDRQASSRSTSSRRMAGDESESVRQLVATVLSRNAAPKWTDALIKLVKDPVIEVAREAATGLGKIADAKARGPLLEALSHADKDNRQKFLEALRDGIGGEGLVLALGSVSRDKAETTWHQTKQLFDMLRKIADPRAADALVQLHRHEAPHPLGDRGRAPPRRDRRSSRGALPRQPHAPRPAQALLRHQRLRAHAEARRQRARRRRAHARRPRDPPPRGARRHSRQGRGRDHLLAARQARAARQRPPLPRRRPDRRRTSTAMRKWANPSIALPKEGQQPPLPARVGSRAERAPLRRLAEGPAELGRAREGAQAPRPEDRRHDGLADGRRSRASSA